jgi:hypothetical protein
VNRTPNPLDKKFDAPSLNQNNYTWVLYKKKELIRNLNTDIVVDKAKSH